MTSTTGAQPVPGAVATVLGQASIVARTDDRGDFSVRVPDGDVTLVIRNIGYKRQQVVVPANQNTVSVQLEQDVLRLAGMVATGDRMTPRPARYG